MRLGTCRDRCAFGFLTGLLGVGGGFVIVPALSRYTNLDAASIVATSLAVIALVSTGAVATAVWHGSAAMPIAVPFAIGAILALLGGRLIAARLSGPGLQQAFAVVCAGVSIFLFVRGVGWISV